MSRCRVGGKCYISYFLPKSDVLLFGKFTEQKSEINDFSLLLTL